MILKSNITTASLLAVKTFSCCVASLRASCAVVFYSLFRCSLAACKKNFFLARQKSKCYWSGRWESNLGLYEPESYVLPGILRPKCISEREKLYQIKRAVPALDGVAIALGRMWYNSEVRYQ